MRRLLGEELPSPTGEKMIRRVRFQDLRADLRSMDATRDQREASAVPTTAAAVQKHTSKGRNSRCVSTIVFIIILTVITVVIVTRMITKITIYAFLIRPHISAKAELRTIKKLLSNSYKEKKASGVLAIQQRITSLSNCREKKT